jgi:hypothetical protein
VRDFEDPLSSHSAVLIRATGINHPGVIPRRACVATFLLFRTISTKIQFHPKLYFLCSRIGLTSAREYGPMTKLYFLQDMELHQTRQSAVCSGSQSTSCVTTQEKRLKFRTWLRFYVRRGCLLPPAVQGAKFLIGFLASASRFSRAVENTVLVMRLYFCGANLKRFVRLGSFPSTALIGRSAWG